MGELIVSFSPVDTGSNALLLGSLVVALVCLATTFLLLYFRWIADYNYRLLVAMLLFFAAIIGGGTAFYTQLTSRKLGPVQFFERGLSTPYGDVPYEQVRDAFIETDEERALINPNQVNRQTRILIIQDRQDRVHLLSEANYPVDDIFQVLKDQVKARD
jgi:hypothetical protein